MTVSPLPIDSLLDTLLEQLKLNPNLVLVAPPGSGKTTRVPPALLAAPWLKGTVLLLQPRRIAVRAAANRIAEERGWCVGQEVGYQIRFERCASAKTRLEVVTEGILTRRLQADPALEGVGAVILDEFHERNLHSDVGLALLREVQHTLRPELRLLVMSATLDAEPIARYLANCPILHTSNRVFPVSAHYRHQPVALRELSRAMAATVRQALVEDPRRGHVLCFLPGMAEIRRTAQELGTPNDIEVAVLHGSLPLRDQTRVLAACSTRRIILATNVAETSLTIPGVTCVVDSGYVRLARFDPRNGLDQLELTMISAASATQRAGRAGREGPGQVYRLWTAAQQASLPQHTPAEIRRVDLASTVLELHAWGTDPHQLSWFDAPDAGAIRAAEQLLCRLGALVVGQRGPTALGRNMLRLPLHPRLARMLIAAAQTGLAAEGAALAALLSERDVFTHYTASDHAQPRNTVETRASDVLAQLESLQQLAHAAPLGPTDAHHGPQPINRDALQQAWRVRCQLLELLQHCQFHDPRAAQRTATPDELLNLLLYAYPDRVARRREAGSHRAVMVGGKGLSLAPCCGVRDAPYFIAVTVDGTDSEARVLAASAIDPAWLATHEERWIGFDAPQERVIARQRLYYADLLLSEQATAVAEAEAAAILQREATRDPWNALRPAPPVQAWITRLHWLGNTMPELALPHVDDATLRTLLPQLCLGKSSFSQLRQEDLLPWLSSALDSVQQRALERYAPARLRVPSGRELPLTYREQGPPQLSVALQELFGVASSPHIANGRVPVLLELLAPNRRPVQLTQDLASFWQQTYPRLRTELSRRYPRHSWPEDPRHAQATSRPLPRRSPRTR